jgi:hypothetical protein
MLETLHELIFVGADDQRVTIPAGTACIVYNRRLHNFPDAPALVDRAIRLGEVGPQKYVVVLIRGQPRLLKRSDVGPAGTTKRARPRKPAPAAKAVSKQRSLFEE